MSDFKGHTYYLHYSTKINPIGRPVTMVKNSRTTVKLLKNNKQPLVGIVMEQNENLVWVVEAGYAMTWMNEP